MNEKYIDCMDMFTKKKKKREEMLVWSLDMIIIIRIIKDKRKWER